MSMGSSFHHCRARSANSGDFPCKRLKGEREGIGSRGQVLGRQEVTWVSTSLGKRREKEVRIGDEEVDIEQVVSAGGWGNEERMSSIFFTK